jgi:galactose-1-phosphate uridylyltransferase
MILNTYHKNINMNVHTAKVTCALCGGDGVTTPELATKEWFGVKFYHNDPRICASNLANKKQNQNEEK